MAQRILVVDDDRHIVRLVRAYLEQAGFVVSAAYDGEAALHAIRSEKPDLVVLDLMLPQRDGWEITRIVREDEHLSGIPIIMLTARVEDEDRVEGLELGADDYVPKPFNPRELTARVRAVLRRSGKAVSPAKIIQVGALTMDVNEHVVRVGVQPIDLTPTEFDLLHLFLENPNRAFTRTELIEKGLGYAYEGMERTIDSHIKNLRKKTGLASAQAGYIETVYGVGYRLLGDA